LSTEWHMRKSTGVALLLAGVSAATYYTLPPETFGQLALAARPADARVAGAAEIAPANAQPASRVFSPTTPLLAQAPAANADVRLAQVVRPTDAPKPAGFVAPLSADSSRRLASSKPTDDDARRELTRDLQKELKRVGCFDGEINGTWSPASKKAMSAFMDRVNATLPVEDPDYILLTLVQGHAAQACGKSCPPGQGLSNDSRCLPRAILAQTARKSDERRLVDRIEKRPGDVKTADAKTSDETGKSETGKTETGKTGPGPSGLQTGLQTGALAKPPVGSAVGAWATATVASEATKLAPTHSAPQSAQAAAAQTQTPQTQAPQPQVPMAQIILPPAPQSPAAAALPGRMAMGAPVPSPDEMAKLDDLEARKRRAQAALIEEQKLQAKAQAEAERLKAERLSAEAERRERQVAAADARRSAQRQAEALEAERKTADAAGKANDTKPATKAEATSSTDNAKIASDSTVRDAAVATAAAAAATIAAQEAAERRANARRAAAEQQRVRDAREARAERERERAEREKERDRERRVAAAQDAPRRAAPRYVPSATIARVSPQPTPRPAPAPGPDKRWSRTFFSDISKGGR
jgi:hypothetical protein